MGNGYKYTNQQLQHHNSFNSSRNFLPLLCRLSLKDVKFPKWSSDSDRSSSSSSSSSSSDVDDPSSPKVSCIGQVKKRNNKLISCQITSTAAAPTAGNKSADNFRYTKLRKLFSGKNLLTTATSTTTAIETGHHHSCKIRSTKEQLMIRNGSTTGMRLRRPVPSPSPPLPPLPNVGELDPPLPVVKKVVQPGGDDSVNLWKRRNGFGNGNGNGIRLNGLQIQQIHVPTNINLVLPAPTTV